MPIYEYQCQACENQFEKLQKMSDDPLKTCPECEKDELVKLVSAAGFQLKGSGWYVTDFRGDKKSSTNKEKEGSKETAAANSKDTAVESTKASSSA